MKPFMNNRDLLVLLPTLIGIHAFIYFFALVFGYGPVPPLSHYLGIASLIFWTWFAAFVLNTVLHHVERWRNRR